MQRELMMILRRAHSEWDFALRWNGPKTQHRFKRRHDAPAVPQDRLFSGMTTSLTLIFSAWEEMKEANRWSLSDVGADYLISLSNWPESRCHCFASAELTYPNLISVHKSIRGPVFIFVCRRGFARKCKRLIHKKALTDDRGDVTVQSHQINNMGLVCFLCQTILGIVNMNKITPQDKIIQWLLCCENQIKRFPPRKMKFHLIAEVMMYAMGQAERGDNDDSHLTYLLAYTGLPSAILWLI